MTKVPSGAITKTQQVMRLGAYGCVRRVVGRQRQELSLYIKYSPHALKYGGVSGIVYTCIAIYIVSQHDWN